MWARATVLKDGKIFLALLYPERDLVTVVRRFFYEYESMFARVQKAFREAPQMYNNGHQSWLQSES